MATPFLSAFILSHKHQLDEQDKPWVWLHSRRRVGLSGLFVRRLMDCFVPRNDRGEV
jgi:hypothetical protein